METPLAALGEALTKLGAAVAAMFMALMAKSPRGAIGCVALAVLFVLLALGEVL